MKGTTITVVGNLITPVSRRNLGEGRSVANFRIACNERRIDRSTGEWSDGDTFYIGVSCWRELAENTAALFGVGDPIIVRGRIYTSTYDGKDGRRSVQEIDADAVGPDLARCHVSRLTRTKRGAGATVAVDGAAERDDAGSTYDDDLSDPRFEGPQDISELLEEEADPGHGVPEQVDRLVVVPAGGR